VVVVVIDGGGGSGGGVMEPGGIVRGPVSVGQHVPLLVSLLFCQPLDRYNLATGGCEIKMEGDGKGAKVHNTHTAFGAFISDGFRWADIANCSRELMVFLGFRITVRTQ